MAACMTPPLARIQVEPREAARAASGRICRCVLAQRDSPEQVLLLLGSLHPLVEDAVLHRFIVEGL
jgi:hypothetical protein